MCKECYLAINIIVSPLIYMCGLGFYALIIKNSSIRIWLNINWAKYVFYIKVEKYVNLKGS